MSDTLVYLGEETLADLMPGVVAPVGAAEADLNARISAFASFRPVVALPMLAQLQIAENIVAGFNECISLGVEPPSLSVQIQVVADALAALRLQLGGIQDLLNLLGAGVHAYAYDGTEAGFGPAVTGTLTAGLPGGLGPTEHIDALVIATSLPASWLAIAKIFRVSL